MAVPPAATLTVGAVVNAENRTYIHVPPDGSVYVPVKPTSVEAVGIRGSALAKITIPSVASDLGYTAAFAGTAPVDSIMDWYLE
jgi:hypothetical protein